MNQLCRVPLDMGGGIKSCDITGNCIIVLLVDGTVGLLWLQDDGEKPSLQLSWPELAKGSKVTLITAYTDTSGMFVTTKVEEYEGGCPVGVVSGGVKEPRVSIDDEDELLYGDVDALTAKFSSSEVHLSQPSQGLVSGHLSTDHRASVDETTPTLTNWCALAREDGCLEVYHLQQNSCSLVLCVRNFSASLHTLKDCGPMVTE